jgi:glucose-6-phosphate isomerase
MVLPSSSPAWSLLQRHANQLRTRRVDQMFADDPKRAEKFTVEQETITLDYSKQLIDEEALQLLMKLYRDMNVESKIQAMITGQIVNLTEDQPALHMALRNSLDRKLSVRGVRIEEQIDRDRTELFDFATKVMNGTITTDSGRKFTTVVHIGIGGSSFGPQLALDALAEFKSSPLSVRFLHNVDPSHFRRTIQELDLEACLFVVASKSFRTEETLANATAVYEQLIQHKLRPSTHMVGLTNNIDLASQLGIARIFPVREWIPGRFSIWGPLALTVCLGLGIEVFRELCVGANEMDRHFLTQPPEANIPTLMALLSIWNINFVGVPSHALLPYSERLKNFITYVQQLEMESNGKSVDTTGETLDFDTAPIVWGGVGTTGQHTFYQLLHQGTRTVASDIIMVMKGGDDPHSLNKRLVANAIAQAKALMTGTGPDVERYRYIKGNQPSSSIVLEELNPRTLGALLACYEHKVVVQGFIWGINSFDQWGVELGKELARQIHKELS